MTSLSMKEYNEDIDYRINKIKAMKKIAEKVTLTEFIEQYNKYYDYVSLASLWHSVNQDIDRNFAEELNISYGGTDPD